MYRILTILFALFSVAASAQFPTGYVVTKQDTATVIAGKGKTYNDGKGVIFYDFETGQFKIGFNNALHSIATKDFVWGITNPTASALSVWGRSANSTGSNASIVAGSDFQVLRRSGTSVGFGSINLSSANAITGILPVSAGGTGIFTLGTANQILAVDNGGTFNQYKTLSLSTTAISNDIGWNLANSGAIALHIPTASGTVRGALSSTDWTTFNNKLSTVRTINTTSPLAGGGDLSADRTFSIADAAADGSTKGAAAFNSTYFDASSGVVNVDLTNGAASASQGGYLTTGAQAIAGVKTMNNNFIVGASGTGGFSLPTSGVLTMWNTNGVGASLALSTNGNNHLYSTVKWQIPEIILTPNGNSTDTNAPVLSSNVGLATLMPRVNNTAPGSGFSVNLNSLSSWGNGNYNQMRIQNQSAPFAPISGASTLTGLLITNSINATLGTTTVTGINYLPVETSLTGVTHYGILVNSSTALSGFGTGTPTARLHVVGSTRFDLGSDATGDMYYRNSSGNVTRLPIGTTGQVVTVAGGLPTWAAASGGGGSISNTFPIPDAITTVGPSQNAVRDELDLKADKFLLQNQQTGSNYNLLATDANNRPIFMKSASAQTITIPAYATTPIPLGAYIYYVQDSVGQLTVVAGSGAVQIENNSGLPTTQKDVMNALYHKSWNVWVNYNGASASGITNSAPANDLMKSDGTNSVASGASMPNNSQINLGTDGTSKSSIYATGSGTNKILSLNGKGNGAIELATNSKAITVDGVSSTGMQFKYGTDNSTNSVNALDLDFLAQSSTATTSNGGNVLIAAGVGGTTGTGGTTTVRGGNANASGNNNGGNLLLRAGTGNGSGSPGYVDVDNALHVNATTVSANTTLSNAHHNVYVDASGGSRTITLPAVASNLEVVYTVKKIDSSVNTVTLDASGSETIDGALTKVLSLQWSTLSIQATSAGWYITANF